MSTTVKLTFETGDRPPDEVEREVQAVVEAATGETPRTSQYAGNVVWSGDGVPEIEHVHAVDVPRVVQTRYNDTVDAGDGKIYERIDGQFIAVDSISSPELDLGNYVLDYFRLNYGVAPWYRYSQLDDPGTAARPDGRDDWQSILSPDVFEVPDFPDETAAADALTATDRARRDRAVRYFAFEGTEDPERYEQFLEALPTVDEQTRALVGSELWVPTPPLEGITAAVSLARTLLALVDDPVPEIRIGAFMGASRAIESLYKQVEDDTVSADALDDIVASFYEAHASLLADTDPRVRERVTRCLSETLGARGVHIFYEGLWLRIGFSLRWDIVRAIEENVHDDRLGTVEHQSAVTTTAFHGEQSAVPALVEYSYHEQGPSHRAVRAMLADFATDEPAAALDALDPALEAIKNDKALVADIRLLAAVVAERPDRVATVAEDLAAILEESGDDRDKDIQESRTGNSYVDQDDPEEKQRAAARVLSQLPADTHPVDQTTIAAVTDSITREEYGTERLVPERVATLIKVNEDTAIEKLCEFPEKISYDINDDQGFRDSRVDAAISRASREDAEVVVEALPDLIALVEDAPTVSAERIIAIARTAVEYPDRVAAYAAPVATLIGHYEPLVREAATTAVVAIGQARPAALPTPYTAFVQKADVALDIETLETIQERNDMSPETPEYWPAGVIASEPAELSDIVTACLDEDFYQHEQLADLVREVRASDPGAAQQLIRALLEQRRSIVLPSSYRTGVIERLGETDPAVLVGAADSLVSVLADPAFETRKHPDRDSTQSSTATATSPSSPPSSEAQSLEAGLLSVARSAPGAAVSAIESHYPSVQAFSDDHETDRRREIASCVGDSEVTPRVTETNTMSGGSSDDGIADPFLSFQPDEYGTDLVVDKDDTSAEPTNEELQLVTCRVTENNRIRRISDNSFVRRVIGPDGPIGTIPDDTPSDEEMVSLVTHSTVPAPFIRLANPEDENVLTRIMDLDMDISKFQLFAQLCQSVGREYSREEIETIEQRLDQLGEIEEIDGAAELVQKWLV